MGLLNELQFVKPARARRPDKMVYSKCDYSALCNSKMQFSRHAIHYDKPSVLKLLLNKQIIL